MSHGRSIASGGSRPPTVISYWKLEGLLTPDAVEKVGLAVGVMV